MKNKESLLAALQELQIDIIIKQKRGLHFILTSVFIWSIVLLIHATALPITTKNLLTFCCSTLLMPVAYALSKLLKIDFQNKDNPLSNLGLIFSLNQMLYILISMWVYVAVPTKMLMVYAMIFGAHLLPYGWLYQSKSYYVFSILITLVVFFLGLFYSPIAIAGFMLIAEISLCLCLGRENKSDLKKK